jgi:phospholipase C
MFSRAKGTAVALAIVAMLVCASSASGAISPPTPIRHVVVIYQENHSFDDVLGRLCVHDQRCDGVTSGELPGGRRIPLSREPDVVPNIGHMTIDQQRAINGGLMNGFSLIPGCSEDRGYACYTQYRPSQIPNLAELARKFVISDRTFHMATISSWVAHIELVAARMAGFTSNPLGEVSMGWGCDSGKDAYWSPRRGAEPIREPACIPDYGLNATAYPYGGAYRPSDVPHIPTIMDRLDSAGRSWKIYSSVEVVPKTGYSWAICPTFAGCLYTHQHTDQVQREEVLSDARDGLLPNYSAVLPDVPRSQHNWTSMQVGDNWIGKVVSAIEHGPDWRSTAIFITYDDCGCFYDHVAPPPGLGIRVPMVIVSPYARRGYTDSHEASIPSILAFTEHVFGLQPLGGHDRNAYDYARSFNFAKRPAPPITLRQHPISAAERARLQAHPPPDDGT